MGTPDLDTIRRALEGAPKTCRYHAQQFGFLGYQFGEPRCESCQQPWRVVQALAALDRLEVDAARSAGSGLRMATCTCEVITGGARVRRHRCPMHPDNWADGMRDQMAEPPSVSGLPVDGETTDA